MNKYAVAETIGEGSFAVVRTATARSDGTRVAIKTIKEKQRSWEACLGMRELRSLKSMGRHDNIVTLRELILDKETHNLHFVFEFLPCNLHQAIKKATTSGGFSDARVVDMSTGLLSGLAHMHARGFMHRDLKPENILCDEAAICLKIADLGLAREIRSRPPYTAYVATRWYRAPELVLGSVTYSSPVDVWAMGCIIYELLTLQPLLPGSSDIDMASRMCSIIGTFDDSVWKEGVQLAKNARVRLPVQAPPTLGARLRQARRSKAPASLQPSPPPSPPSSSLASSLASPLPSPPPSPPSRSPASSSTISQAPACTARPHPPTQARYGTGHGPGSVYSAGGGDVGACIGGESRPSGCGSTGHAAGGRAATHCGTGGYGAGGNGASSCGTGGYGGYGGRGGSGTSGCRAGGYAASGYGASGYGTSGYVASGCGATGYGASGYGASFCGAKCCDVKGFGLSGSGSSHYGSGSIPSGASCNSGPGRHGAVEMARGEPHGALGDGIGIGGRGTAHAHGSTGRAPTSLQPTPTRMAFDGVKSAQSAALSTARAATSSSAAIRPDSEANIVELLQMMLAWNPRARAHCDHLLATSSFLNSRKLKDGASASSAPASHAAATGSSYSSGPSVAQLRPCGASGHVTASGLVPDSSPVLHGARPPYEQHVARPVGRKRTIKDARGKWGAAASVGGGGRLGALIDEARLRSLFERFDADRSGAIDRRELPPSRLPS